MSGSIAVNDRGAAILAYKRNRFVDDNMLVVGPGLDEDGISVYSVVYALLD